MCGCLQFLLVIKYSKCSVTLAEVNTFHFFKIFCDTGTLAEVKVSHVVYYPFCELCSLISNKVDEQTSQAVRTKCDDSFCFLSKSKNPPVPYKRHKLDWGSSQIQFFDLNNF